MRNLLFTLLTLAILIVPGCAPDRDDDHSLLPAPDAPEFSIQYLTGDSNRVVITDLSEGSFQRLWQLPGGTPKVSSRVVDTIFYTHADDYLITLYVSKENGSGSASASKTITILQDAPIECNSKLAFLTGDCSQAGKCWTFTTEAGAVKVGPTYGDFSWFTSPVNGLQDAQYDDDFCFYFLDFVFINNNKGQSVNPWNGYMAEDYNPGSSEFLFLEGTGTGGRDQIIIPDNQFMGVWDADNVMDVMTLTADQLVLRMRIRDQSGAPVAEGWFELTFVAR